MSQSSNSADDEIDLHELFAAVWSHKFLITIITGFSIFLAGYYILTAEKKFSASAIFQIEQKSSNSNFDIPADLNALASLAGFKAGSSMDSSKVLLERVKGREFILEMKKKLSIESDPFFNSYNPDYKDPFWKDAIKKIIGWQKTSQEESAIIERNILQNYRKNVIFEITDAGAIKITVTHIIPKRASEYANNLMEEIRQLIQNENIAAQKLRLNYLSETLADAIQEMENAQEKLKDYALQNSAMAQENFITDSLKLDQIRMEKRKVSEIAGVLLIIEDFIKSGNLDNRSFEALRSNHPLVDDIEFRRILGMSETISAWTWPEIETLDAVSATLRDRIKRLDIDIKNIEENAKIYASSAEGLAKLRRDAKISEATYTVLIEQVKSQSLAAGFKPETFKVFESASPPLTPSSPKRTLVFSLATILGILIGIVLALFYAISKNVYYTKKSLLSDISADLALKSKPIRRLSKKSIDDIVSIAKKNRIVPLDEAVLKLSNKKIIYVLNSGGKLTAPNVARLLATQSALSGRKVLFCDTTRQSQETLQAKLTEQSSDLPIIDMRDNLSLMEGENAALFFTAKNFNSTFKNLINQFDQIFLCTSNSNAQLGLMALLDFVPALVLGAGTRKTKRADVKNIIAKQPIDLLFYD